eukprot:2486866-Ditylum_brightwellii.AAC.1
MGTTPKKGWFQLALKHTKACLVYRLLINPMTGILTSVRTTTHSDLDTLLSAKLTKVIDKTLYNLLSPNGHYSGVYCLLSIKSTTTLSTSPEKVDSNYSNFLSINYQYNETPSSYTTWCLQTAH